ncbi:hypothetical protein DFH06DRAFT_1466709 [Mycena polygramma]|nr:hypothetical protein DFH06DRAFT_1466709 [Mycena polygramma]
MAARRRRSEGAAQGVGSAGDAADTVVATLAVLFASTSPTAHTLLTGARSSAARVAFTGLAPCVSHCYRNIVGVCPGVEGTPALARRRSSRRVRLSSLCRSQLPLASILHCALPVLRAHPRWLGAQLLDAGHPIPVQSYDTRSRSRCSHLTERHRGSHFRSFVSLASTTRVPPTTYRILDPCNAQHLFLVTLSVSSMH